MVVLIPTSDTEGKLTEVQEVEAVLVQIKKLLAQGGNVLSRELPVWRVKGKAKGKL